MSLVDLHTHTTESDGTFTPEELIRAAVEAQVKTLAITDHDTMTGYDTASEVAGRAGIDLIRGIELTCRHSGPNLHLLAYFFDDAPPREFDDWLEGLLEGRRDRNRRLAQRLQELGMDVSVAEAEVFGKRLAGRPHFARVLVSKGYVSTMRQAFDRYIGEAGEAYVEREAPQVADAVNHIRTAGGVASLAHPGRYGLRDEESTVAEFAATGLGALEVFHSDHTQADVEHYLAIAAKYGLAASGGSDFHGANKPGIELGRGINGNLRVPEWVVPALRERLR